MGKSTGSHLSEKQAWFATTLWTQVAAASDPEQTRGFEALESLSKQYWYPLYAFARQKGYPREDARDLVQGFFEKLLSHSYLAQANPNRGRFRSFLLGAFKHYMLNQRMKDRAQKRGGGRIVVSLDDPDVEERFVAESANSNNPEREYDRRWAKTLLEGVMDNLRSHWETQGRLKEFGQLKPHMLKQADQERYGDLAHQMGISEAAVKMKVKRLREQYREILHRKVADIVQHPSEIQGELAYLQSCLQGP